EDEGAQRPDEEPDREEGDGAEERRHGMALLEELHRKDGGQTAEDVEVVPFNDIPHRGRDDHTAKFLRRQMGCRHSTRPVTVCSVSFALLVLHGRSMRLSRPLHNKLLAWQRRRQGRGQLKFEPDEVPETGAPAVRQYELIEEEERTSVWEHLTGQELCDVTMPARCGGQNLQTTPRVRDAGNFPAVPEERGPVVIRPQHFQGLAVGGAMTRQGDSTIGSHGFSFAPRSGSRASTRSGHPRTGNGPAHRSTRWPAGGEGSQAALHFIGDRVGRRLS